MVAVSLSARHPLLPPDSRRCATNLKKPASVFLGMIGAEGLNVPNGLDQTEVNSDGAPNYLVDS